jgi:hypothetical protein
VENQFSFHKDYQKEKRHFLSLLRQLLSFAGRAFSESKYSSHFEKAWNLISRLCPEEVVRLRKFLGLGIFFQSERDSFLHQKRKRNDVIIFYSFVFLCTHRSLSQNLLCSLVAYFVIASAAKQSL